MSDCVYELDGGAWICQACGDRRPSLVRRNCPQAAHDPPGIRRAPPNEGPGTELKRLLGRFGIVSNSECGCDGHALVMNDRGVEWCHANVATIVGWLREEAANRSLFFSARVAELLVRRAIHKAQRAGQS